MNDELEEQGESRDLLWSHALHEDNMFLQMGNFFLVTHSMLVVGYSLLSSGAQPETTAATLVAMFGLVLAAAWTYVAITQHRYILFLAMSARETIPYYRRVRDTRPKQALSKLWIMSRVVPISSLIMWILLLLVAL